MMEYHEETVSDAKDDGTHEETMSDSKHDEYHEETMSDSKHDGIPQGNCEWRKE